MPALKEQFNTIVAYLAKKGLIHTSLDKNVSSMGYLVSKLLDEWKKMPENERRSYEEEARISQADKK